MTTSARPEPRRPRTILLVEDDESVALSLARALTIAGYGVMTADRIAKAVAILSQAPIDAILLDLRLSGSESGLDLLSYVRSDARYSPLPVVILTGVSRFSEKDEALIRKLDAYIFYKPASATELLQTLDRIFSESSG